MTATSANAARRLDSSGAPHYACHRSLALAYHDLRGAAQARSVTARVEVVAVPAARNVRHLVTAARAARAADAHLLLLCSRGASAAGAHAVARAFLPDRQVTAVDLPPRWSLPGLNLRTDQSLLASDCRTDTALKRNLALVLATALGTQRLLFLDDDVRGFADAEIEQAEVALAGSDDPGQAIGWAVDDYPDNSLVCHARRMAGAPQSTFIGGGALAVQVTAGTPFFPTMYNEDWLFLAPYLTGRRNGLVFGGTVRQKAFDVFGEPSQAARQEAADALAEGVFSLLHQARSLERAATEAFWQDALDRRRRLLVDTKEKLIRRRRFGGERAVLALDYALLEQFRGADWSTQFCRWFEDWQTDLRTWRSWRRIVPRVETVDQALRHVGLAAYARRRPIDHLRRFGPSAGR